MSIKVVWKPHLHPRGKDGKFVKKGFGVFLFGKTKTAEFKLADKQIDVKLDPGDKLYTHNTGTSAFKMHQDQSGVFYNTDAAGKSVETHFKSLAWSGIDLTDYKLSETAEAITVNADSLEDAEAANSGEVKAGDMLSAAQVDLAPPGLTVSLPSGQTFTKKDNNGFEEWVNDKTGKSVDPTHVTGGKFVQLDDDSDAPDEDLAENVKPSVKSTKAFYEAKTASGEPSKPKATPYVAPDSHKPAESIENGGGPNGDIPVGSVVKVGAGSNTYTVQEVGPDGTLIMKNNNPDGYQNKAVGPGNKSWNSMTVVSSPEGTETATSQGATTPSTATASEDMPEWEKVLLSPFVGEDVTKDNLSYLPVGTAVRIEDTNTFIKQSDGTWQNADNPKWTLAPNVMSTTVNSSSSVKVESYPSDSETSEDTHTLKSLQGAAAASKAAADTDSMQAPQLVNPDASPDDPVAPPLTPKAGGPGGDITEGDIIRVGAGKKQYTVTQVHADGSLSLYTTEGAYPNKFVGPGSKSWNNLSVVESANINEPPAVADNGGVVSVGDKVTPDMVPSFLVGTEVSVPMGGGNVGKATKTGEDNWEFNSPHSPKPMNFSQEVMVGAAMSKPYTVSKLPESSTDSFDEGAAEHGKIDSPEAPEPEIPEWEKELLAAYENPSVGDVVTSGNINNLPVGSVVNVAGGHPDGYDYEKTESGWAYDGVIVSNKEVLGMVEVNPATVKSLPASDIEAQESPEEPATTSKGGGPSSDIGVGDVIRVGAGKKQYTVTEVHEDGSLSMHTSEGAYPNKFVGPDSKSWNNLTVVEKNSVTEQVAEEKSPTTDSPSADAPQVQNFGGPNSDIAAGDIVKVGNAATEYKVTSVDLDGSLKTVHSLPSGQELVSSIKPEGPLWNFVHKVDAAGADVPNDSDVPDLSDVAVIQKFPEGTVITMEDTDGNAHPWVTQSFTKLGEGGSNWQATTASGKLGGSYSPYVVASSFKHEHNASVVVPESAETAETSPTPETAKTVAPEATATVEAPETGSTPADSPLTIDAIKKMSKAEKEEFKKSLKPANTWKSEAEIKKYITPTGKYGDKPQLWTDVQDALDENYWGASMSLPMQGWKDVSLEKLEALRDSFLHAALDNVAKGALKTKMFQMAERADSLVRIKQQMDNMVSGDPVTEDVSKIIEDTNWGTSKTWPIAKPKYVYGAMNQASVQAYHHAIFEKTGVYVKDESAVQAYLESAAPYLKGADEVISVALIGHLNGLGTKNVSQSMVNNYIKSAQKKYAIQQLSEAPGASETVSLSTPMSTQITAGDLMSVVGSLFTFSEADANNVLFALSPKGQEFLKKHPLPDFDDTFPEITGVAKTPKTAAAWAVLNSVQDGLPSSVLRNMMWKLAIKGAFLKQDSFVQHIKLGGDDVFLPPSSTVWKKDDSQGYVIVEVKKAEGLSNYLKFSTDTDSLKNGFMGEVKYYDYNKPSEAEGWQKAVQTANFLTLDDTKSAGFHFDEDEWNDLEKLEKVIAPKSDLTGEEIVDLGNVVAGKYDRALSEMSGKAKALILSKPQYTDMVLAKEAAKVYNKPEMADSKAMTAAILNDAAQEMYLQYKSSGDVPKMKAASFLQVTAMSMGNTDELDEAVEGLLSDSEGVAAPKMLPTIFEGLGLDYGNKSFAEAKESLTAYLKNSVAESTDYEAPYEPQLGVGSVLKMLPDLGMGGGQSKTYWIDDNGQKYMAKQVPSDKKFRADSEFAGNSLAKLHGFNAPQVTLRTIDGKYASVQPILTGVLGDLSGVSHTQLDQSTLETVMSGHVLNWAISNTDAHGGNFLRMEDGSIQFIDHGQAFKALGSDKLAVGWNAPGNFGDVWYNQFYKDAQAGKVPKETLDKVAAAVLRRAHRVSDSPDSKHRELVEAAVASRETFPKGMTRAAFVEAAMERKASTFDDFLSFYEGIYSAAGLDFSFTKEDFEKGLVEGTDDAHLSISNEFADKVKANKGVGMSLMVNSTNLDDSNIHFYAGGGDNPTTFGEVKVVTSEGDQKIMQWAQDQGLGGLLNSLSNMSATGQTFAADVSELTKLAPNTFVQMAKTVSAHAADGQYNTSTIATAQADIAQLKQMLSNVNVNKFDGNPHALAQWKIWAEKMISDFDQVEKAHSSASKPPKGLFPAFSYKKPSDWKASDEVASKVTMPNGDVYAKTENYKFTKTSGGVETEVTEKVFNTLDLTGAKVETFGKGGSEQEVHADTNDGQKFEAKWVPFGIYGGEVDGLGAYEHKDEITKFPGGGQMIQLKNDEVEILYAPHSENADNLSNKGRLTVIMRSKEPSTETMDTIMKLMDTMGLDVTEATDESMEHQYWRALTLEERSRKASAKFSNVRAVDVDSDTATLKAAWAKDIGQGLVDAANWRPLFEHHPDIGPYGRPYWMRPDHTSENLKAMRQKVGGASLYRSANYKNFLASGINTGTEQRRIFSGVPWGVNKALGQATGGFDSVIADARGGSSEYVFAYNGDLGGGSKGQMYFNPEVFFRTTTYSYNGDKFGNRKLLGTVGYDAGAQRSQLIGGSSETMIKNGIALADSIAVYYAPSAEDRESIVKYFSDRGITHIDGIPIADRVVATSSEAKKVMARVWDVAIEKVEAPVGATKNWGGETFIKRATGRWERI